MKTAIVMLLLLLIACSTEVLTPEQQAYKELCMKHHNAWMLMSAMNDGKIVGQPCYGCMPDEKNHICDMDEYQIYWDINFKSKI